MIVGFQGRKRSGKNEAAQRFAQIASRNGMECEFRAFADPLKQTLCETLGFTRADVEFWKEQDWEVVNGKTMRDLLQHFGESARQNFGLHLWLDKTLPDPTPHEGRLLLITDVRPDYECERVQQLGGVVVRLDGGDDFDGHSTEKLGGVPDYHIDNRDRDGSLDVQLEKLWLWLVCGCPSDTDKVITLAPCGCKGYADGTHYKCLSHANLS